MKFLLIVLLLIAPCIAVRRAEHHGNSQPSAEVNQVVTLVSRWEYVIAYVWSLSGGEWCLYRNCFWRSNGDLFASEPALVIILFGGHQRRASYTITLTTPEGSASNGHGHVVTEP